MTPENFVYWLQGYLELTQEKGMTSEQVQVVKDHIALVLTKVTTKIVPNPWTNPINPYEPYKPMYCTNGYDKGFGSINFDGRADESEQIFCSAKPSVHGWSGEKAYENMGLKPLSNYPPPSNWGPPASDPPASC